MTVATRVGAKVSLGTGTYKLVTTQDQHIIDAIGVAGREKRVGAKDESGIIIHEGSLAEYKKDPRSVHGSTKRRVGLQLFEEPAVLTDTHAWGMSIDMNACIGVQRVCGRVPAENIPVVGKKQSDMHRGMNWLRVDRYFKGDSEDRTSRWCISR